MMLHRIFFPYDSAQIGTTVLEVCLSEDLEASMRRRIYVMKCLWGVKDKLIGRDPHHIPVLVNRILDCPRVTPRKPTAKVSL